MKVTPTASPDVHIFEPKLFGDARGFLCESFNQQAFNEATGLSLNFVHDNHSRSAKGVLRGLNYQIQQPSLAAKDKTDKLLMNAEAFA